MTNYSQQNTQKIDQQHKAALPPTEPLNKPTNQLTEPPNQPTYNRTSKQTTKNKHSSKQTEWTNKLKTKNTLYLESSFLHFMGPDHMG